MKNDILTETYYLTTEEGGRTLPIFSGGYWGPIKFYDSASDWSALHNAIDSDTSIIEQGKTQLIGYRFQNPEYHQGRVVFQK